MNNPLDRLKFVIPIFLILLSTACAHVAVAETPVMAIEVFGSERLSDIELDRDYGDQIREYVKSVDHHDFEKALRIQTEIKDVLNARFHFAYVNISVITYYVSPYQGSYVTVDVVEPLDAIKRMPFHSLPQGHFSDPDGLMALWNLYFNTGMELLKSGKLIKDQTCPAWHCIFSFRQPELASYLKPFSQLVPLHENLLVEILTHDSRPEFRGNAAFLLAHLPDGNAVVRDMLFVTKDPVPVVRNNAVRVLALIAMKHAEIMIPVDPLIEVLNFPEATDRNKAATALEFLSLKKENAKPIIAGAGRLLLKMLKLRQPNNHDPAYAILKNVSGENYLERDYDSWEKWLTFNGAKK